MDDGTAHYELERFTQQFRLRPQRRRLGVDIDQDAARVIFDDAAALHLAYVAWRLRAGKPALPTAATAVPVPGKGNRVGKRWHRLTAR